VSESVLTASEVGVSSAYQLGPGGDDAAAGLLDGVFIVEVIRMTK
jgi:hypothetical protein